MKKVVKKVVIVFLLVLGLYLTIGTERVYAEEKGQVNYVYLEQNILECGTEQNIIVNVGDDGTLVTSASLRLKNENNQEFDITATKMIDNAILFSWVCDESWKGEYELQRITYQVEDSSYDVIFVDEGIESKFGVGVETTSTPDLFIPYEYDISEEDISYGVVTLDENGNEISDEIVDTLDNYGEILGQKYAARGKVTVVLDPGHGGSDPGANGNGLVEKELTHKIALYCKEELEQYKGVNVYLTRESSGGSTKLEIEDRVKYAAEKGATVLVSLHINSATSSAAKGAEVYYPNSNPSNKTYIGQAGGELATAIQKNLVQLGLVNRGTKTLDSKNGTTYEDGSAADYYGIIRGSKNKGFPGLIVEHAFISNPSDAAYMGNEENLQKLGIADATGIASYFRLSKDDAFGIFSVMCENTGVDLKVTANTYGYTENPLFKYEYYDLEKKEWGLINDWTENDEVRWRPQKGNYWIHVTGLDDFGNETTYTMSYYVSEGFEEYQVALNGICYIVNERSIDVGVAYDSTDKNVKFRWLAYNLDTNSWDEISGWSGGNWSTWKPEKGNYWLHVEAMTSDGNTAQYTICFATEKDYTRNTLDLNGICYIYNDYSIDVGVAYDSSDQNVTFRWSYYDLDKQIWYEIADWNGGNWASWQPEKGNYWLNVESKTSDGVTKNQTICFSVDRDYQNILIDGVIYQYRDTGIDFGVAYKSLTNDAVFKMQAYNLQTKQWELITDWTGSNWASWQPKKGDYWVNVQAKNNTSGIVEKTICFAVNKDYSDFSSDGYYEIMGETGTTLDQMIRYYKSNAEYPSFYATTDAPTIEDFCKIYLEECAAEGVKAQVAFCQAMTETGYLRFGGDVDISQFNFAGIGATGGGNPGNSYASVREGIRAQVQHLKAYASTEALVNACVDNRFSYVSRGCAPYVEWLGIYENPSGKGWASAKNYGNTIVNLYIAKLMAS